MDKTTTLMIRAACMVVILGPLTWFSLQFLDRDAKVRECALRAWNLRLFGLVPGDEKYFEKPPTLGMGAPSSTSEPYKRARRECNEAIPQIWSSR